MSFCNIVKNLEFSKVYKIFVMFLKHPLFMFATVKATFLTMKIAQREFPYIHGGHNKANAFRHAIWNLLIAKESSKFSSDSKAILYWTKRITDWHEEFSPNKEMAKLMDLHNNKIGRNKLLKWKEEPINDIVKFLKVELSNAIEIKQKHEFKNFENQLVYIEK